MIMAYLRRLVVPFPTFALPTPLDFWVNLCSQGAVGSGQPCQDCGDSEFATDHVQCDAVEVDRVRTQGLYFIDRRAVYASLELLRQYQMQDSDPMSDG